jgi:hypothetical protein
MFDTNLTFWDLLVVVFYFGFQLSLGLIFRAFSKDASDYFRAGGSILWWLVGASAFMTQFSAWTFTGAAGKAYVDGVLVAAIFFGNAVGYLGNYFFTAYRFRRLRLVTPIEGVRDRFGTNQRTGLHLAAGADERGLCRDLAERPGDRRFEFLQRSHRNHHHRCRRRRGLYECDGGILGDHRVGLHADRPAHEHHPGGLLSRSQSPRGGRNWGLHRESPGAPLRILEGRRRQLCLHVDLRRLRHPVLQAQQHVRVLPLPRGEGRQAGAQGRPHGRLPDVRRSLHLVHSADGRARSSNPTSPRSFRSSTSPTKAPSSLSGWS